MENNQTQQPQPNNSVEPSQSFIHRWLPTFVGIAIVVFVGGGFLAQNFFTGTEPEPEIKSEEAVPAGFSGIGESIQNVPVLIYTQLIKKTRDIRDWPTVRILRKIGSAEPEILAEVGKVGEFPGNYVLSPDRKSLLINLGSKLQILDLSSKELKDLFIPKRQVLSASYSPDSKQLFIWDQNSISRDIDGGYYVHIFTISSRKDQIIKQGNITSPFFGKVWRKDNKIILETSGAPSTTPFYSATFYFDLATNELSQTPGNYALGPLSMSGKVMAVVKNYIPNVCNDYSGNAPSIYNIVETVSGKVVGTIGGSGKAATVLAFSRDDKEVFYTTRKPWTDRQDCNKKPEKFYYKAEVNTGKSVRVNNPTEILSKWNVNFVGARRELENNIWSILINGKALVASDKRLQIVAQYYR